MSNSAIEPLDASSLAGRDVPQGEDAGHSFSLLDSTPLGTAARRPVADLALDLALNEIVQQARLATTATGATIRLLVDGKLVCRAAAGTTAAEISAYLKLRAGIVEVCVATGRTQHCDDAETDPRLDSASCRRLGLRSFLVVPVRRLDQDTLGVIEIFSAQARTFSDRDVLALQALSRRVCANIDLVAKIMPTPTASGYLRFRRLIVSSLRLAIRIPPFGSYPAPNDISCARRCFCCCWPWPSFVCLPDG
jgi:putative methionine-R-sulfoxide reductase with GAF domain